MNDGYNYFVCSQGFLTFFSKIIKLNSYKWHLCFISNLIKL